MAPFTPFVADYIYRALDAAGLSVHLQDWPQLNFEAVTSKSQVLEKMSQVRQVVELGLSERDKAGIPVRQPLAALQLTTANLQLTDDYIQLMKEELNVKEVRLVSGESELSVTLDTVITAELKLEGLKRELVRQINALRKKQGMTIEDTVALVVKTEAEEIKQVLDKYGDEILHSTIANQFGEAKNNLTEVKIGDNKVLIGLKK
jgi:isoleucyl-tRNA synthetase